MARAKNRIDNATSILRLGIALGAGWLLWQRYQVDQQAEQAEQAEQAAPPPLPSSASPMQPLTGTAPATLPASQPTEVAYEGATNDQIDTTRQLRAPQAISLDPKTRGDALVSWLDEAAT